MRDADAPLFPFAIPIPPYPCVRRDCSETREESAAICRGYMALIIDYRSPLSTYRVYLLLLLEILIFISLEILMRSERVRSFPP